MEGAHAIVKSYMRGSNNSLETIARCVLRVTSVQMSEIRATFAQFTSRVKHEHQMFLFEKLLRRVSHRALELLHNEFMLIDKLLKGNRSCHHHLQTSAGLPCACRINKYIEEGKPIPFNAVADFWKKLDFDPVAPRNVEPDYGSQMDKMKQDLLEIPDPNQQKTLFSRITAAWPGNSKNKAPEKRKDPRGRPRMDSGRHSSFNPQESQDDPSDQPRHSSYGPRPSVTLSQSQRPPGITGRHLGFPLLDHPMWVPLINRFKNVLPDWTHRYISCIYDVDPDGNCGFRAIAVGIGKHQNEWPDIRNDMLQEMDTHEAWWRRRFDLDHDVPYTAVRNKLAWSDKIRFAPRGVWFSLPGHGYVVAQTYKCILIHINENRTHSFFPVREGPDPNNEPTLIAVVNIDQIHWI